MPFAAFLYHFSTIPGGGHNSLLTSLKKAFSLSYFKNRRYTLFILFLFLGFTKDDVVFESRIIFKLP